MHGYSKHNLPEMKRACKPNSGITAYFKKTEDYSSIKNDSSESDFSVVGSDSENDKDEKVSNIDVEVPDGHSNEIPNEAQEQNTSNQTSTYDVSVLASAIIEKIQERTNGVIDVEKLSDAVAKKVVNSLKAEEIKVEKLVGNWIYGETSNTCRDCLLYSTHMDVPQKLRNLRKGQYGIVNKQNLTIKRINCAMKRHEENELHKWCYTFHSDSEMQQKEAENENRQACTVQVTNAIFTIKNLGSSYDFIKQNDKDAINFVTANLQGIKPPTKNDGRQEYFDIREKVFHELTNSVRESFKSVKSFSVTLDKVTTGHVPYTVIMTYYFYDGKIHILLNSVYPMKSHEYDGEGTASMVIQVLQDTLNLSKEAIASKCHHFVTDGVYATDEERLSGGGLQLVNHFAKLLGLHPGDVTGNWDLSHLMQLAYNDLIKANSQPFFKKLIDDVFDLMSDFNSGKASLIFKECAETLHYSVLTNKSNQTTRFVRALLRGIQALLRNIPCLYNLWGDIVKECALENDNTGAKEAMKMTGRLSDGKFIASVVGVVQILEEYAKTSLDSQNLSFFPTSVLNSSDNHLTKIKKLSESWQWSDENPKLANIGAPSEIIENLKGGH